MAALSAQQTVLVDALANAVVILINMKLRDNDIANGSGSSAISVSERAALKTALASVSSGHAQVIAGN